MFLQLPLLVLCCFFFGASDCWCVCETVVIPPSIPLLVLDLTAPLPISGETQKGPCLCNSTVHPSFSLYFSWPIPTRHLFSFSLSLSVCSFLPSILAHPLLHICSFIRTLCLAPRLTSIPLLPCLYILPCLYTPAPMSLLSLASMLPHELLVKIFYNLEQRPQHRHSSTSSISFSSSLSLQRSDILVCALVCHDCK